jgi:hypothetical protein
MSRMSDMIPVIWFMDASIKTVAIVEIVKIKAAIALHTLSPEVSVVE